MEDFYNKHYIRIREDGCIIDGFSDAFREPTEDAICINEQGGYQFKLRYKVAEIDGKSWYLETEENPSIFDWTDMIPLFKYEGGEVFKRTEEEIEAERATIPVPEPPETDVVTWKTMAEAITEGVNEV